MRRIRLGMLVGLLTVVAVVLVGRPDAAPEPGERVGLKQVRYSALIDHIKALRGQVVLVDFWADYCAPCKREFPKLVELHRRHARNGLTCVSVSLDDPDDAEALTRVKQFLTDRQATFANFILSEKPDVWQAKLKTNGPPCVFIFNRGGKLQKKYDDNVDYKDIEKIVVQALQEQ